MKEQVHLYTQLPAYWQEYDGAIDSSEWRRPRALDTHLLHQETYSYPLKKSSMTCMPAPQTPHAEQSCGARAIDVSSMHPLDGHVTSPDASPPCRFRAITRQPASLTIQRKWRSEGVRESDLFALQSRQSLEPWLLSLLHSLAGFEQPRYVVHLTS